MEFRKATKAQAKARIAIDGPSGSGKTYTALMAATVLGQRIAVIDTERGSASLYADRFAFDTLDLEAFSPATYVKAIHAAEAAGYDVIVIDSLSHAWTGKGGALEMVDQERARSQSQNAYTAWRVVTPEHNALVDAMLQSPCHIVATMRTKMEYVLEEDDKGKKVPRKVGMEPVQRGGMEYEFTIVGDMDLDHTLVVTKSRMTAIADAVVKKPGFEFFEQIRDWLTDGEASKAAAPVPKEGATAGAPPYPAREEETQQPEVLVSSETWNALTRAAKALGWDKATFTTWMDKQYGRHMRPQTLSEADAQASLEELVALQEGA